MTFEQHNSEIFLIITTQQYLQVHYHHKRQKPVDITMVFNMT